VAEKIVVSGLYKVFGPRPEQAMELLRQGRTKDEIFRQTGMVVGVRDANFSVDEGEIFVLMGLSGSGKSTLVRLLNRLVEPTHGRILVGGHDVAALDRKALVALRRKDMAMVFQSFALLPHRSVLNNAAFGLEVAGVDRRTREKRALAVLEQVGLAAFAHKLPAELSGGMQQRVGLARALAVDPSLMLMDEAFSALDPLKRTEMQDLLLQLQREQQRTIVFVSHDLDEAFRIGDRIAIMEGGRIVQIGTPDEILRHPSDAYVRAFFKGVDVKKYLLARDIARADAVPLLRLDDASPDLGAALVQLREAGREHGFVLDGSGRLRGTVSIGSLLRAQEAGAPHLHDALLPDRPPVPEQAGIAAVLAQCLKDPRPLAVVDDGGVYLGAVTTTILLQCFAAEEA